MTGAPPGGPPAGPGSTPGAGPASAPLSTPQPQEGLAKAGRVDVQIAIKQLQKTLPAFPIESDENKAVLSALKSLSAAFGKTEDQDRELIPAEILQLLSLVNKPGAGEAAMGQKPNAGAPAGAAPPIPA